MDVSPCGDHPSIDKANIHIEVGKGPVKTAADGSERGFIATSSVLEWLVGAANKLKVAIQLEASDGGTDANAIYITRSGIPTGSINVASRYSHIPVEIVSLNDIDKAVDIVARAPKIAPKYFG